MGGGDGSEQPTRPTPGLHTVGGRRRGDGGAEGGGDGGAEGGGDDGAEGGGGGGGGGGDGGGGAEGGACGVAAASLSPSADGSRPAQIASRSCFTCSGPAPLVRTCWEKELHSRMALRNGALVASSAPSSRCGLKRVTRPLPQQPPGRWRRQVHAVRTVRQAALVRVPRACRMCTPRASCPAPQVRTVRRRPACVSTAAAN